MTPVVAAAASILMAARADAIITADAAGTHLTTPGQLSFLLNTDGVVSILNNGSLVGTGTLISDRHILTAAHVLWVQDAQGVPIKYLDPFGSNQVFFDVAGGGQLVSIAGMSIHSDYQGNPLGGSDIAILELANDAPAAAPRYPIYTRNDEIGRTFIKAGYGLYGWGGSTARSQDDRKRAGLNRYDASEATWKFWFSITDDLPPGSALVYDFDDGSSAHDAFGLIGIPNLGNGVDEVNTNPGDSGGPAFLLDTSDLRFKVAGITSYGRSVAFGLNTADGNFPTTDGTFGETTVDTRVSAFDDYVNDVVLGTVSTLKARTLNDGGQWVADSAGTLDHYVLKVVDHLLIGPTSLEVRTGANVGATDPFPRIPGVEVFGFSDLEMSGGAVSSPTIAAKLNHFASAEIDGGIVEGNTTGIALYDATSLNVTGGTVRGNAGAGIELGSSSSATATIRGGDVIGGVFDLVANSPLSQFKIHGQAGSFNLPLGTVAAVTGTITGLFADGSPFNFSFSRGGGGAIELIATAIPGDYNQNGVVDAADYVAWRNTLGQSVTDGTGADGSGNGLVDQADYDVWSANFAKTTAAAVASLATSATVPEPNAILLAIIAALVPFLWRPLPARTPDQL